MWVGVMQKQYKPLIIEDLFHKDTHVKSHTSLLNPEVGSPPGPDSGWIPEVRVASKTRAGSSRSRHDMQCKVLLKASLVF